MESKQDADNGFILNICIKSLLPKKQKNETDEKYSKNISGGHSCFRTLVM